MLLERVDMFSVAAWQAALIAHASGAEVEIPDPDGARDDFIEALAKPPMALTNSDQWVLRTALGLPT